MTTAKYTASKAAIWAGAVLGALATFGVGAAQADSPPQGIAAVVHISSFLKFEPNEVTIPVGGTVEWRNSSIETHTVTDDPAAARDPTHAELPAGAEAFDSGPLKPGQTYRHTFETPGRYRYFCRPHEMHGMSGAVVVAP
jgi:plastocyanin